MALQDPTNPLLYKFSDALVTPDPFYTEEYAAQHKGKKTTIVIDNGCSQCRVGWASEKDPQLVFRNAIARTRGKKGESDYTCIGNDITNVEAVRSSLKNQFDRDLVSNFVYQEQILDHAFSHLGLHEESSVDHPVVLTEPVCNPSYCRGYMSELLFENYNIPAVAYGIDALFSAYHSYARRGVPLRDALVVSSGHQATHIMPVLDGKFDARHCKRINVGGLHTVCYLHRLLQLKYPGLQTHVTLSRAQELVSHHSYIALDYAAELKDWAAGRHEKDFRLIQLPYTQAAAGSALTDVSREVRDKQRRQRAREQLLKLNQKRREEKIASYEAQLERLLHLQQLQELMDPEDPELQLAFEEAGVNGTSSEALSQAIDSVQTNLEGEQQKLATLLKNLAGELPQEEVISEEWLQSLRERRREIMEQKRQRQLKKQELGKRRSAASQNRMRIISQLAEDATAAGKKSSKRKEDTFGMNDDDWNVYRTISKNAGDSDSEKEDAELSDIAKVLEKHDPAFMRLSCGVSAPPSDVASYYQMLLGVERFRVPEIVFQPTMVGVDQCGVTDTIEFILQTYPPDTQQRLVNNVFVSGGNTLFPNFKERLEVDLQAMRPFQSTFTVTAAEDRLLDAWRGACTWANTPENRCYFITRAEYTERGTEYFKEHVASNLVITPPASSS